MSSPSVTGLSDAVLADAALADAAFGSAPGAHPLPAATESSARWQRAVALGGQGRFAAAEVELAIILRRPGDPYASLAASTRGSHLRQLGNHAEAAPWDGRAFVTAATAADRVDAMLGLAADALGSGAPNLAQRLLRRSEADLGAAGWRGQLRWQWVSAETALCEDRPASAREHGERGAELGGECRSLRHQVKSRLVLAAARGSDGGAQLATELADRACALGLVPLQWASLMLVDALEPGSAATGAAVRATTALLARRSVVRTRPDLQLRYVDDKGGGQRMWANPTSDACR